MLSHHRSRCRDPGDHPCPAGRQGGRACAPAPGERVAFEPLLVRVGNAEQGRPDGAAPLPVGDGPVPPRPRPARSVMPFPPAPAACSRCASSARWRRRRQVSSEMWHGGGNASSEADALDARDGVEVSVIAQDGQPVLTRQRRNPNVVLGYGIARLLQFEPNIGIRARGGGSDGGNLGKRHVTGEPILILAAMPGLANAEEVLTQDNAWQNQSTGGP